MNPNDNGQNAGNAVQADPNAGNSASGDQGGSNAGSLDNAGNPGGQNSGQQTDPRDAELVKAREEIRKLNQAIVDSRRNQNRNNQGNNQQGDPNYDTPEGQYALSLQIATGNLIQKMENVYEMYPEVPAKELARIRKNPWAFASQQSYMNGDVDAAALEIEQVLLDRTNELQGGGNPSQPTNPGQPNQQPVQPAQVNSNPAMEAQVDAEPGSDEDTNPWTMPMNKLAKEKNKEVSKLRNASK